MPRASGNDLAEIFGYAPDDRTDTARKQWKSQQCPFVGGVCIKHSHPQDGRVVVYGTCSVLNRTRSGIEEVIVCPQRLYAEQYESLRACVADAIGSAPVIYMADEYSRAKRAKKLPNDYIVMLGHNSGGEIALSNPGVIELSLDWVMALLVKHRLELIIPCEVQSIDTTGNYHANWQAYSNEEASVPNSKHGMNWANVWKRLIPQLVLKGSIAATSSLCKKGSYFVVPDRVYVQFEKIVGQVPLESAPGPGVLNVMTYSLGGKVAPGYIRPLVRMRKIRTLTTDFAQAFASGKQLPLGSQLDAKVRAVLAAL